jgi:hypothetical protein
MRFGNVEGDPQFCGADLCIGRGHGKAFQGWGVD